MARIIHIALAVAAIAIAATVILAVALPSYAPPANRPGATGLNVKVVVVGSGDFAGRVVKELSGRVSKVVAYGDFDPEILQHADRSTLLALSSDWLKENAGREEIKEMIKRFIDEGSMIYVDGARAGVFQKMLYEMMYEKGVESGAPQATLQELGKRMESIPEESQAGIGYMKVSEKHEVLVFGSLEDALKTLAEYRGMKG